MSNHAHILPPSLLLPYPTETALSQVKEGDDKKQGGWEVGWGGEKRREGSGEALYLPLPLAASTIFHWVSCDYDLCRDAYPKTRQTSNNKLIFVQ